MRTAIQIHAPAKIAPATRRFATDPGGLREPGLEDEQRQAGHPRDEREDRQQHHGLAQHVVGAGERARQVQRQGAVHEVGGDEHGRHPGREQEGQGALDGESDGEELRLHLVRQAPDLEEGARGRAVGDVDPSRLHEEGDQAHHEERHQDARLHELLEPVARHDQEPPALGGERAVVRPVDALMNRHRRPPCPSSRPGRCPPASRAGSSCGGSARRVARPGGTARASPRPPAAPP